MRCNVKEIIDCRSDAENHMTQVLVLGRFKTDTVRMWTKDLNVKMTVFKRGLVEVPWKPVRYASRENSMMFRLDRMEKDGNGSIIE